LHPVSRQNVHLRGGGFQPGDDLGAVIEGTGMVNEHRGIIADRSTGHETIGAEDRIDLVPGAYEQLLVSNQRLRIVADVEDSISSHRGTLRPVRANDSLTPDSLLLGAI
jgi:hypothetical protein